jgi:superfamily II DNA/RNA helicase
VRLGLALNSFVSRGKLDTPAGGAADVAVLLRQIIRALHPLSIPATLWDSISDHAEKSGLFSIAGDRDQVEVMARPWFSTWLANSEALDTLERRREDEACPGDGMLGALSQAAGLDWTTYQSSAQKAAVDSWMFAAAGSTTLVTLPTGGGKSLCALLPPWFATRGGRRSQGATLVVVPTVALALDQERQSRRFFKHAVDDYSRPICWTGDTPPHERTAIQAALRDGRLPLIYTSPESLLGSRLYNVCLKAAGDGLITRFVIDEAHLIHSWGAGFRPEFQLLAAYRRRLLEASHGKLRTLLLSATMNDSSRSIVEKLFAEPGKFVMVQANRLRPEIGYWLDFSSSDLSRRHHVNEALRYLPRPLILYVTRPEQARSWEKTLRDQGYERIASYSGETDADTRRQIIKAWDDNQIDVMIATSAFGLGVDKSDVRTILHATLPENVDRFYQEVGRGGRDGFSSVSLVCAARDIDDRRDDIKLAYSLQPRVITVEKALPRWQGMIDSAVVENGVRWIDRDATPRDREGMPRSERNRDWNDHLLLLMQRAGLIRIEDAPPPQEMNDETFARIPVQILDPQVYNDPQRTLHQIEAYRDEEKESAYRALQGIIELVQAYTQKETESCLASKFARVYDDVQYACGGCPACRRNKQLPYSSALEFAVEYPTLVRSSVTVVSELDSVLSSKMNAWHTLNVTWTGERTLNTISEWSLLIADLMKAGFQQIVYPSGLLEDRILRDQVIQALAQPDPHRPVHIHRFLPDRWITEKDYPLLPLNTALIFPPDDRGADRLFRTMQHAHELKIVFPATMNIIHEALYLPSAGKRFIEHVNGLTETVGWLQSTLKGSQMLPEYF